MDTPNYYAIIPANVRYNKNLPYLEKFLYCEFTALSNLNGYCMAKNKYFAELYEKDEKTISRAISHLEEMGFIHIEYEKVGARITKRKIYPLDIKTTSDKIVNGTETTSDKNITREQQKLLSTIDKIVTDNNSSYKYIINLIMLSFNKDKGIEQNKSLILEYFNNKAIVDAIEKWIKFKAEKKQSYKETGLKGLLTKLKKDANNNGEQYVIDCIEWSISQNYSGIYPPKEQKASNNSSELKFENGYLVTSRASIRGQYTEEDLKRYDRSE